MRRILVVGTLLLLTVGCDEPKRPPKHHALTTAATPMEYRGMAVQIQSGYKPVERFTPLFHEIRELGANTVLIITAGFMEHAKSQQIFLESRKLPASEEFKAILRAANDEGLKVILMPIILLAKPRGSEWRGVIDPPDWNDWWAQYREFIVHFCDIAREGHAHALMVGSELISTEKQEDRWREVIALARENFYGGKLGYSANWDHYRPVKFWDALDIVGMTSYYTLAKEPNPSVDELIENWQPIKREVLDWQATIGKPILFTEVGWCSQEGAATAPWNYYHNQHATPAALEEQRRLYEAFLHVWDGEPGVCGAIWWDWSHDPGGPGDFGYTPRNKPAERVLRDWFARYNTATAPATTTAPANNAEPSSAP